MFMRKNISFNIAIPRKIFVENFFFIILIEG